MRSHLLAILVMVLVVAAIILLLTGEKQTEPVVETPSVVVKPININEYVPPVTTASLDKVFYLARKAEQERKKREEAEYQKAMAKRVEYLKQLRAKELAELRAKQLAEKKAKEAAKNRRVETVKQASVAVVHGGGTDSITSRLVELGVNNASFYVNLANKYGNQYGVDPIWILAMAKTESHFNSNAVSSHEAIGIMQLLPSTGQALGVSPSSLYDPEVNIKTGTKYLAMLQSQFGNIRMATIAYNQGEGNVRNGTYRTWYYDRVLENYNTIKR